MPWLTALETADRYRISVSGLLKQRAEGRPPGSLGKRAGKRVLWSSITLDAFDGEPATFDASHAMVLELQAVGKLLRKMNVQLNTIARYLERAEARQEEQDELAEVDTGSGDRG